MTNDIRFVDCDSQLQRRVGEVMGNVAERHIRLEDGFAIVAMDADTPIGVIAVYRRPLTEPLPETHEGFINIIEVAETYRRRGIAKRLVQMSIERCRNQRLYQIRAWSSEGKTQAIHMWKSLGFALCPATVHPSGIEVNGYFVAHPL